VEGTDAIDGAGEFVVLNTDLPSPRGAGPEADARPFDCTGCLSVEAVWSKDRRRRSVEDESLTPPFSISLSFSGPSSKSTRFLGA
jgi:hypothetical protein